jgi:hypothetical protein
LAITGKALRRWGALPSAVVVSEVGVTDGGVSVLIVLAISSSTSRQQHCSLGSADREILVNRPLLVDQNRKTASLPGKGALKSPVEPTVSQLAGLAVP